jgi:rod shape determining protein RodA
MNLIIPSIFLSVFGLFNLFGLNQKLFFTQLIYVILGFAVFFIVKKIGRHFFHLNNKTIYWFFIFVLLLTFFIGLEVKGSKRWLNLYFFNFQSSEIFKAFFIIFMADYLTVKNIFRNNFLYFIKSLFFFLLPFFIIFKQPDLGNALIYFFIYFSMVLFSDFPKKYLGYFIGVLALFLPIGWFFLKGYQKTRLLSFFSPHLDTQGTAYNMIQSMITIGSGMFFGRGLGLGTQARLYFLPESTTDFAYASLVEQFGFFGGAMVIIFFGIMIFLLIKKTIGFYYQRGEDGKKIFLYCVGIVTYLTSQVAVNIGMNMGLLPIAGVALPFISYGGSSILALLIGLAILP